MSLGGGAVVRKFPGGGGTCGGSDTVERGGGQRSDCYISYQLANDLSQGRFP